MFSKRWGLTALVAAGALLAAGCTPSSPKAGEETQTDAEPAASMSVTLGLTYIPNVQFAPAYVAKDDGNFAEQGVDVEIRHHGADEGLFTSLLAGQEDMVIATGDEMFQARSQGMDLISVGQYYAKYPVVIIVKEDSGIETVQDLAGKSVGLPGEFGSNWYGLLAALSEADMTRDDIEVTPIGFTQLSALQTDQVDAVVGFTNNDSVQFDLADVAVREIPLVPDGNTPLVGANIVTTSQFANENPDAVKAVLAGLQDGKQTSVDDPDHAVEITQNYDPNLTTPETIDAARATLVATNDLFAEDGKVTMVQDLDTWNAMNEFLQTVEGLMAATVNVDEAVTNEYVK
ncbi:MAG: ABC transporter substrate-binding protein [Actinomycetaceae bacterium]|nr:ABC transporter substrate-binding protein [Actinomycetaceae bacterium]